MWSYIVRLSEPERDQLEQLVRTGRHASATLTRARILLQADRSERGPGWRDRQIVEALGTSLATVHRVRQQWVECGLDAALYRRKPTGRQFHKLDGAQEAQLIALACSEPPAGRVHWTMKLLAQRMVELAVVPSISAECVRTALKKTSSSRGSTNVG